MKRTLKTAPAFAAIVACGLFAGAATVPANDTLPKAQDAQDQQEPAMSLVLINDVKPAMVTEYEQALAEMCAVLTEHKADPAAVNFFSVSGPEMGHVMVIPLADGFNSMDTVRQNWMSTIQSIGMDRMQGLFQKMDSCLNSHAMIHSVHREDLSYEPKNPAVTQEEVGFAHYQFMYVFPGKEMEFAEIAKEWKTLYEKHNISLGWHVYEQVTGENLPVFLISQVARSESEFHALREKAYETIGAEAAELAQRSTKVVREIEMMTGYPRPDLSYPTMTGQTDG